jgi:glycosyltransferase involved in cell wall biosynthesis
LPNHPLQVLVYTDSASLGGAEISLGHLVGAVTPAIQITVVGVAEAVVQAIAQQRPQAKTAVLPRAGPLAYFAHWRCFRQLRPDLIHLNLCTPWAGAMALSLALSLPQVRVLRVDQLPLRTTDALTLWRTRALCLRVDAHGAVGEASARRMEDFYALGRNSVLSIPNGVPDLGVPDPVPGGCDRDLIVGNVARLNAMKAQDILLQAIAQVEGTRLVIVGEGSERPNLEQLAHRLGIQHRVDLLGWADQPRQYLADFDVVAIPSRSEGFPLAMVEAMLAARPVIATRVGSMPEAILPGQTGLLVEKNDCHGLAAALRQLRDNPALRGQLGQQARQLALSSFTVETMARQYEQLWRQMVAQPRKPRLRVTRPLD